MKQNLCILQYDRCLCIMFGGPDTRFLCLITHVHKAFSFGLDVANILCYICTHTVSCHEFTQQYLLLNSCSTHCSTCLYLGCGTDVCIIYPTVLKAKYQDMEQQPTLFSILKPFVTYLCADLQINDLNSPDYISLR